MSADLPGQFLVPLVPKLATKLSLEQLSYIKISKVICLKLHPALKIPINLNKGIKKKH